MLDGIFAVASQLHQPIFDDKYSAEQAITQATFYYHKHSSGLLVVFLPWHMPQWFADHLARKHTTLGYSVLTYYFSPNIIEAEAVKVVSSFEFIALAISKDVQTLHRKYHYENIDLLGISLGNVALCITAEKLAHFNKVVMLVPGDNLSLSLWNGWRTRRLRNKYRAMGNDIVQLQKEWSILAPSSHVDVLRGHEIHIVLGQRDRFIPYSYGRLLVNDLQSVHAKVVFSETPFGHIATILSYQPKV